MKAISLLYVDKLHHENSEIGSIHLILRLHADPLFCVPSTVIPVNPCSSSRCDQLYQPRKAQGPMQVVSFVSYTERTDRLPARRNKGSNDLKKLPFRTNTLLSIPSVQSEVPSALRTLKGEVVIRPFDPVVSRKGTIAQAYDGHPPSMQI